MPLKILFVAHPTADGLVHMAVYYQDQGPLPFIRDPEHAMMFGEVPPHTFFASLQTMSLQGHEVFVDTLGQVLPWQQHFPDIVAAFQAQH